MFYICGRKVKIVTGQPGKADKAKTQTVNICTVENVIKNYDYVLRLYRPHFTSEAELQNQDFKCIEDCVKYLQEKYHAKVEKSPSPETEPTPKKGPNLELGIRKTGESTLWERKAASVVEDTIDQFILEFISFPYLHRREHSIHCELYRLLVSRRFLSGNYPIGNWFSQLVHKEWPEHSQRPGKTKRGTIDLCILSPERLKSCPLQEFLDGRIEPAIAIEIGLDYKLEHLEQDSEKLLESRTNHRYLIHLIRQNFIDDFDAVEQFVLHKSLNLKTAYARLTGSQAFYKLTNNKEIITL